MKKLKDIKGLLSREEMRQIQGGSGVCTSGCLGQYCACLPYDSRPPLCCGGLTCVPSSHPFGQCK